MGLATAAARLVAHLARIRYRLLLVNAIVAAVPVVGISFAEMHETQLLAALETDMIHQAELVRAMVVAAPDRRLAEFEAMLAAAATTTRTRIRLLDASGALHADSHRGGPPEGAERPVPQLLGSELAPRAASVPRWLDLATRREVQAALAGRYGAATRTWQHQDRVFLFSALPIHTGARPRPAGGPALSDPTWVSRDAAGMPSALDATAGQRAGVAGVVYVTRSTHDVRRQLYRLRSWLFQLLIATLGSTALVSLVLATTIARPLGRLTRRARRIAAQRPVEPDRLSRRADEIGQLARAVEAMTAELERRARDARSLAADISHEFKTPLTAIRGAAELLRDGASDEPADRDRFLAMILDDAARLDRLVSRLLELARVEDDRGIELPVDLAALAAACADRRWPVAVEVTASGDPRVFGRGAGLASAIENLVANATQFAEPATVVRVAIERRPAAVRVTVANHGPPLSAAARARVWDRFYSTRAGAGGTGLGLAIVRSVAHSHGGSVGVDCHGGITSFWFELPV